MPSQSSRNSWKRKALALLSVPLLALPSAAGVYLWLSPHIGLVVAGLTAAGFECLYLSVNILVIGTPELRRYARNVALSGVATAIIFNTLARYQAMVCPALTPEQIAAGVISSCTLRTATFDGVALGLAILESIPLAGLAYAMSVLLHRLSEDDATRMQPSNASPDAYAGATVHLPSAVYARPNAEDMYFTPPIVHRACPQCNAALDAKQYAAAKRWKHCAACKDA